MLFLKCGLFLSIIFALVVDTLNHSASFNFVILTAVISTCDEWAFYEFPKGNFRKEESLNICL